MYKLFLTIRYLTRRKIVIFPVLVVWLCLMMMIIVTSIMGGFVDRVRETNRELLGDIIISSPDSPTGWPGYDALQAALKKQFPEIVASTPVALARGLANVPLARTTVPVEVMGINPAQRAKVSRFRPTLFKEYISPHEAADDLGPRLPATNDQLIAYADRQHDKAMDASAKAQLDVEKAIIASKSAPLPNFWWLIGVAVVGGVVFLLVRKRPGRTGWSVVWAGVVAIVGLSIVAVGVLWPIMFERRYELATDRANQAVQLASRWGRDIRFAVSLPPGTYHDRAALLAKILPPEPSFNVPPGVERQPGATPAEGCIVGVQMGFFNRDKRGNFERAGAIDYLKVLLTVFPASQRTGSMDVNRSITKPFTIVDDSYSGVYDVDQAAFYAPFKTVQVMAGMRADPDIVKDNPDLNFPPRASEVLIRLHDNVSPHQMKLTRQRMNQFVQDYVAAHDELADYSLIVQTWDERQAKYLGAVENEKVMQTFILGLMSLVVLVVIFLIFYMIVRDKTRDIGIIKAIGGSEEGVAGIFLTYGLFIGVVGGALGVVSGVAFVTHTNQIHEFIYQMTGITIWDRSVYLFDRIPDTVHPREVAVYFALAVLAGVIGALIPAIVAAAEDPVKAVRFE